MWGIKSGIVLPREVSPQSGGRPGTFIGVNMECDPVSVDKQVATDAFRGVLISMLKGVMQYCHAEQVRNGWWHNPHTGEDLIATGNFNVPEKLALIHSEISEALEAHRKNLMDDKLPHRKGIEVELADAFIRIADLGGALRLDIPGAVAEKLAYNATRLDHKPEHRRAAADGKRY